MRTILRISAALGFLSLAAPAYADVPTFCTNCSNLVEQIWQEGKQAEQLAAEVTTKATVLNQYANMIRNTASLPLQLWSTVQSDLAQVRAITQAASLLAQGSGGMLARLNNASSFASQAQYMPTNFTSQYQMWQTTLGNAYTQLGRQVNLQQGQQASNIAVQLGVQQHSQTAVGQMQAIQAGTEMAALTNSQLQQIHATMMQASQAEAAREIVLSERQAAQDAYTDQFFSAPYAPLTGYPRYK